jgi:putative SOS response-associated peptidase YedK
MCGRYTCKKTTQQVAEHFHLPDIPGIKPRYNIAPSQELAAIKADGSFVTLQWGFIRERCETDLAPESVRFAAYRFDGSLSP